MWMHPDTGLHWFYKLNFIFDIFISYFLTEILLPPLFQRSSFDADEFSSTL